MISSPMPIVTLKFSTRPSIPYASLILTARRDSYTICGATIAGIAAQSRLRAGVGHLQHPPGGDVALGTELAEAGAGASRSVPSNSSR